MIGGGGGWRRRRLWEESDGRTNQGRHSTWKCNSFDGMKVTVSHSFSSTSLSLHKHIETRYTPQVCFPVYLPYTLSHSFDLFVLSFLPLFRDLCIFLLLPVFLSVNILSSHHTIFYASSLSSLSTLSFSFWSFYPSSFS